MKVYKKILSILLLVVLSFNTVIALEARSAKIEYIGKVTSSTGSTVGRFKVNGQWAFCVDHAKTSPPSNTSYDSGSIYNNESIRAILYYGYGGIGNEIGTSNDAWVATTLALDSVMNNNDSAYRRKIPGYSILMDHAQKKDAPSTDASFSKSSVTSSVSGDRQVSETITFNADYRNSITLAVQSGTVGNSDITIKFYYDVPLIKAGLKKIQIYTEQADKGLPVKVEIDKKYIYDENIADMSNSKIKLGLYDNSNNEVISKEFTAKTLPEMLDMTIPSTKLKKDSSKSYTLKIEGYDSNMVDVISNAMSLTTDGYTSSEKIIKVDSSKQDNLSYRGVVMTEREVGKNMKVYYETLDIPLERIKRMRTGYGFEVPLDLTYINEIGSNDLDFSFDFKAQDEIVDKSYIEYSSKNGVSTVALENTSKKSSTNNNVTISKQKFELQHINVEKRTGALFNDNQVNNQDSRIQYDLIDGGRKFYLPIWARIGDYQANVESTKDIGINKINVEIGYDINIYAHMYAHMDSESILDDAIILEPIDSDNPFPNGIPKGWTKENLDALNEMLDEKLNKGNLSMSSIFGKKK